MNVSHDIGREGAAPYALVIIALAAIPGCLLGLWFDRGPRAVPIAA